MRIIVVSYSSGEIFALNENNGSIIWFDNISTDNFFQKQILMIFSHQFVLKKEIICTNLFKQITDL